MSTKDFFKSRTDWARRKHLIISYYLDPAVKKLRAASPDGKVFVLDGFAGPGIYEDGTKGSPLHTAELVDKSYALSDPISLYVRNVEQDAEHFQQLERVTDHWVRRGFVKNLNGRFQEKLPDVLKDAGQSPLVAFLDPFNHTELVFNDITPLLQRRAKTEICAVFFTRVIQRHLQAMLPTSNSSDEYRQTMGMTLTGVLGTNKWRQLVAQNALGYEDILGCLTESIQSRARDVGEPGYVAYKAVHARKGGHMQYHIVHWTRHMDGVLLMNDAFVKETGDLEEITEKQLELATGGQVSLTFDEPDPKDVAAADKFNTLCDSILRIGAAVPSRIWSRRSLIEASVLNQLGVSSVAQHRQAIQTLADKTIVPKIVVNGKQIAKTKKWIMNDNTELTFRFQ